MRGLDHADELSVLERTQHHGTFAGHEFRLWEGRNVDPGRCSGGSRVGKSVRG